MQLIPNAICFHEALQPDERRALQAANKYSRTQADHAHTLALVLLTDRVPGFAKPRTDWQTPAAELATRALNGMDARDFLSEAERTEWQGRIAGASSAAEALLQWHQLRKALRLLALRRSVSGLTTANNLAA